jgi:hypothetical protein
MINSSDQRLTVSNFRDSSQKLKQASAYLEHRPCLTPCPLRTGHQHHRCQMCHNENDRGCDCYRMLKSPGSRKQSKLLVAMSP